jgi:peroxiredoxin
MHEHACNAAKAAHCAGTQGKFWEMHDLLYDDQKNLDMEHLKERAQKLGLNLSQWNACLDSPSTVAKIRSDIKSAAQAGISGTPRMYINGRLLSGAASPAILSYMIEKSAEADRAPAVEQIAATPKSASQVSIKLADSSFFIDAFEASIDKNGRAVTRPNSHPAHVSWFDAKAACEKSNKRLCSEKEWVSSCTGQLAVDNNKNGFFADDDVEGRMYPYGDFYERGRCRDSEDKYKGTPGRTGSLAGCRTGTGIYDLAGNISEWVGNERRTAALVGGDYRSSSRASCNKRSAMYGPGYRNKTTGFRCCSDQPVQPGATKAELDDSSTRDVVDNPIAPDFFVTLEDGTQINANWFRGKTTYLTFFASWCGSCKRELPALNQVQLDYKARGLHILAIGTDRIKDRSLSFAKQFKPVYSIALDPDSTAMGLLKIDAMPASFLIDSKGVIRHRTIGFRPEDLTKLKSNLEGILGQ